MQKKNQFLKKIKEYFPKSKQKWKIYFSTAIPVILASMIFAFNAFVDNFMSTKIPGGNQALSYANTWTEMIIGIIALTTIVGTAVFAQFLGKRDIKKVKEVISVRLLFALFISLAFALPAWIVPVNMVETISGYDPNMVYAIKLASSSYLRLIAVSWVINSVCYTFAMILREKNHTIAAIISSVISLVVNIIFNSIFIFGLSLGIEFLAYSTIISNVCSLLFIIIFMYVKDHEITINFKRFFIISKDVLILFFKRITSFILLATGSVLISLRFVIWNKGYGTGTIGDPIYQLSAANVLGISGMFFNIFWTSLEAVNTDSAIFIAKELGANNFNQAKQNAKELQGFHLIISLIMTLLLFCLSFAVEKMTFLTDGYKSGLIANLKEVGYTEAEIAQISQDAVLYYLSTIKYSLWPLAFFMPVFIWFITRARILSNGGYTNLVGAVETIFGGLQLGWIALICFVIDKNNDLPFEISYLLLYLSDLIKLAIYEILYHKINWVKNITGRRTHRFNPIGIVKIEKNNA